MAISLLLLLSFGCTPKTVTIPTSVHLTLGNPSNATNDITNENNYLMLKPQYALSYNNTNRIPNWVSWQLNKSWLGSAPRQNNFRPDDTLPQNWYRVTPNDYTNSGYDRGHMTPSADRTNNETDNSATFLMSNMIPQAPENNQGPWAKLEDYCRDIVVEGNKELYIVSGGYGSIRKINDRVSIPARTWKVIVVLDKPGQGVGGVTSNTRVIAVDLPNSLTKGLRDDDWRTYRTTVRKIEAATGYNLLSNVPKSIQNAIENRVDSL